MRPTATCPDCGAYLETWTGRYRCPWSRVGAKPNHEVDGTPAIACRRPYESSRPSDTTFSAMTPRKR